MQKMEKVENKKGLVEKIFLKVNSIDKVLESKVDTILLRFINMLKYIFIVIMIVYLAICLMSLSHKMISTLFSKTLSILFTFKKTFSTKPFLFSTFSIFYLQNNLVNFREWYHR